MIESTYLYESERQGIAKTEHVLAEKNKLMHEIIAKVCALPHAFLQLINRIASKK